MIKIVTAPDILFEQARTLLVVCPSATLKEQTEKYLESVEDDVNVYLFTEADTDIKWLLTVANMADYKLIDVDNCSEKVSHFLSYLLTIPNTYYKNEHLKVDWKLINKNRFFDFPNLTKEPNEIQ